MRLVLTLVLALLPVDALAQALSAQSAERQLFAPEKKAIQVSGSLSKADQATIKALIPLMEQQMQGAVAYYSSIAYAPDQGLVSDALQGAFNHHSVAAADRAALRACSAAKPRGAGACRIAARVLPRGYEARPFSLSASATQAFSTRFNALKGAKVFAVSPATGAWGFGADQRTAINGCRRAGARDCAVVVQD